jgi:serine/threonine protein kinase/Flp pilus assembly protein TadD
MNPTGEGLRGSNGLAQQSEPAGAARLAQALEEYRGLLEAGAAPDRAAFLARYSEMAEELAECLSGLEFVHAAAPVFSGDAAAAGNPGARVGPGAPLGDFRILREVGRGGMGVVYEAEQLSLGRRVALKVLPLAATLDPRQLQRFRNEAQAAAGLHHPNIVPVYAVGCERGVHYYAMQFIDGRTLADLIAELRGGRPSPAPTVAEPAAATAPLAAPATSAAPRDAGYFRRAAEWGIQAAEALDCAHALDVVHRDVKPANLLVDGGGRLWVTDFGLAQVQSDARLTRTGDLVGTLHYMSPEQALARRQVIDHRTDVYSLGATLYELLTLQPAFEGGDRQELLRQIAFEEPRPPRRVNRAIPAELETVVLKALEKNPADRYATAKELADDLRHWLEDRPIRARRPSPAQRLRKWGRRHRAAVWAAAVCLLVTLVALGGSAGWVLSDQAARQRAARAKVREAEGKVKDALMTARPGLEEGNPWDPELTAALQRAEAQLDGGAVGPALQARVRQLRDDVHLLRRLEEIRLRLSSGAVAPEAAKDFAAAFRTYGIDVEALGPAEAVAAVRASAIRAHLVTGLDDWAQQIPRTGAGMNQKQRLLAVARQVDPDPWRNQLRDVMLSGKPDELERLARSAPVEELPAATLGLLGRLMAWSFKELPEPALDLLRRAQHRFPSVFWINYNLAQVLSRSPSLEARREGIGYFRVAVALRPQEVTLHLQFAAVLHGEGRLAEAEAELRKAIELKPGDVDLYRRLGDNLRKQGKPVGPAYRKATELNPRNTKLHQLFIDFLLGQGQPSEVKAAYRRAIELNPHDGDLSHRFADYLLKQGKPAEVEAALRKAVELRPHDFGMHRRLGEFLLGQGRTAAAEAAYRKSIDLNPNVNDLYQLLADCLLGQKKPAAAEAVFRKGLELHPRDCYLYQRLGDFLLKQGRSAEARAAYLKSLELQPTNPTVHRFHGDFLSRQGRLAEAEAAYRKAAELSGGPHPNPDWAKLREILLKQRRPMKSVLAEEEAYLRKTVKSAKDRLISTHHDQAHADLGKFLSNQGRYQEAEAEYREAVRLNPHFAGTRNNLGIILFRQGRYQEAEAEYRAAVRLKPNDPVLLVNRGNALACLGQWEKASAEFLKATACRPLHAGAWYSRAVLCLRDGDRDGYRKVCSDMLGRFGKASAPASLNLLAWTCVLAPGAVAEAAQLVPLAEKAVARAPMKHAYHCTLGTVLYRAGRFDAAARQLTEASVLKPDPNESSPAYTWFFLALAHQRLGHAAEARQWLGKGIQAMDEELKQSPGATGESVPRTGAVPPPWNRELTLRLLRHEAETQIQGARTRPGK